MELIKLKISFSHQHMFSICSLMLNVLQLTDDFFCNVVSYLQLKISIFLVKGIYYNFISCMLISMISSAYLLQTSFQNGEEEKEH